MNLISCDGCGIVFDKDKINFPNIYSDDSWEVIRQKAIWTNNQWIAMTKCPVCKAPIFEKQVK